MRRTFFIGAALLAAGLSTPYSSALAQQPGGPFPPALAAPVQQLAPGVDPIISSRQEHARLGITLSDNSQGKVWIKTIEPNSGADEAGLRPNDQIVALDDTKINTYLDVVRYVNNKGASDDVAIHIRRNGRPGMLTASLGSEYAAPSSGQVTEYPGNVRQRSYSPPVPATTPQRAPGLVVPNTRGPYNR
jgi:membrane-associated protease RseP (regulator of RpoE activity)